MYVYIISFKKTKNKSPISKPFTSTILCFYPSILPCFFQSSVLLLFYCCLPCFDMQTTTGSEPVRRSCRLTICCSSSTKKRHWFTLPSLLIWQSSWYCTQSEMEIRRQSTACRLQIFIYYYYVNDCQYNSTKPQMNLTCGNKRRRCATPWLLRPTEVNKGFFFIGSCVMTRITFSTGAARQRVVLRKWSRNMYRPHPSHPICETNIRVRGFHPPAQKIHFLECFFFLLFLLNFRDQMWVAAWLLTTHLLAEYLPARVCAVLHLSSRTGS